MYGIVTINVLTNENVRSEKSLYGLDRISLWVDLFIFVGVGVGGGQESWVSCRFAGG